MKNFHMVLIFAALCFSSMNAQGSTNDASASKRSDDSALKDQLVAQVDAFMNAWEKRDAVTLTATMAPEFLYVTSRGVTPRDGIVGALTHACTLTSYSLSEVRAVPISTDSAALVYKITQSVSCMGHPDPPVVLNTDTLVRRGGQWLFLLTTSTPAQ